MFNLKKEKKYHSFLLQLSTLKKRLLIARADPPSYGEFSCKIYIFWRLPKVELRPQIWMILFECSMQGKIEIYGNTWDIACMQTLYSQKLGNLKARFVRYWNFIPITWARQRWRPSIERQMRIFEEITKNATFVEEKQARKSSEDAQAAG